MVRVLVFDLETDRLLSRPRRDNHRELRVTVACACLFDLFPGSGGADVDADADADAEGPRWITWVDGGSSSAEKEEEEEQSLTLEDALGPAMDEADAVVAYNGRDFDLRVLRNSCASAAVDRWERKLIDPFEAIRRATGSWVKLDELLEANCLPRKAGDGVSAVDWWAAGEKARVAEYCRSDVEGLVALVSLPRFAFPIKTWRLPAPAAKGDDPANTANTAGAGRSVQVVTGWAELDWSDYFFSEISFRDGGRPPPEKK